MKVKEDSEKHWLKTQHSKNKDHGIQYHNFIASRWRNNGISDRLYFLGLKITVDGDCSHKIKSRLLLRRKKSFLYSSVGKESTCKAGDLSLIPGTGRSTGELIGYPLKYCWAFLVAQLVKNLPAMWET